ncbi:hypothetical protein KAFR_0A04920 [Kazachstania africana CBS 2517]|uniref:Uncharacterized protein n=1 Tax=Kazachstania africana (strain ATCC 22294 / BCRC 22015 / CBS 2517 / CECT 1963 / NBRC 1671 / NRRL Y-8276) TaxID=1071382 RepID=H2ANH8_KAZAF|nr:hypothetical protein KAFR_0A04920 [Kazachstania africana CBS 2517]CCF55928.1 hypothetical protein KAFR_0A04920 [Kazachstania africana CBS 2517]
MMHCLKSLRAISKNVPKYSTGVRFLSIVANTPTLQKSMSLNNIDIKNPANTDSLNRPKENADLLPKSKNDLIKTLSEQLILETHVSLNKPSRAENQLNTMEINDKLLSNGFTKDQSTQIITAMINLLNNEFYFKYNDLYLYDFEINKQLHLFNFLQSEIQYIIKNSREIQFNLQNLQIMKLQKDLNSNFNELNELVLKSLQKDSNIEFNNQKYENSSLYSKLNLDLNDCNNKITIKMLSGIKYDIENLRWHTTRSGLIAILFLVSLILTGVNVTNNRANKRVMTPEKETKKDQEKQDDNNI